MKKLILSLFIFSIVISSCESDNGVTYTTPDYLSGKWNFTKVGNLNAQNSVIYQDYPNTQTCELDNIVFNSNGTYEFNDFSVVSANCVNMVQSGDFTVFNKDITLSYTEGGILVTKPYTVIALTYQEMTIVTLNDLGQSVYYKLTR